MRRTMAWRVGGILAGGWLMLLLAACKPAAPAPPAAAVDPPRAAAVRPAASGEVVVYVALDREFSEPILTEFERQSGLKVLAKYDSESTKTVGLVNALRAEKERPRCDVFWNNEIVNTVRLKQDGLLQVYAPPGAKDFPATFRDPDETWTGFAARARILLVNTDLVKPEAEPRSIYDLIAPQWKGRVGLAKPLFGTTASHAACLFGELGEAKAAEFFAALKANGIRTESGNKAVALAVSAGRLAFGLTDTDDAIIEVEAKKPVKIVYPDAAPDQMGVLFLPNTVSLLKGAPHPEAGQKLIDYLLSPAVEIALAKAEGAQIPLNPAVTAPTRVKTPREVKAMPVDFDRAASLFQTASDYLEQNFLTE